MSDYYRDMGYANQPRASDDYWAKRREEEREQRAREKAAWERFCGMLGPIGRLRD